jgi:hypothetical protein
MVTQDGTGVHVAVPVLFVASDETTKANASLIAAAPEMYHILNECAKQLAAMGATAHADKARAILAKARGKS